MESLRRFWAEHRTLLSAVAAVLSFGIGVLYLFVVPEYRPTTGPALQFLLRYAHSACWLLLAITFALIPVRGTAKIRKVTAYTALALYAGFMVSFLLTR